MRIVDVGGVAGADAATRVGGPWLRLPFSRTRTPQTSLLRAAGGWRS